MAVSASGLFGLTFRDALLNTIALDLDLETHKIAMFTNSITPNFDTDTAYGTSPYNGNEVSGTGYSAGGATLTGTTLGVTSGRLKHDGDDVSWSASTISNARCALEYADALGTNNAICLVNFGGDYSTNNGTFAIQWSTDGIWYIDYTP